jgi:hypothetical protein
MEMEAKDWIALGSVLVSVGSLCTAIFAIRRTGFLSTRQTELQAQLNAEKNNIDNKRYTLILWDKLDKLKNINLSAPIATEIRDAINMLELIAQCWQGSLVDQKIVVVSFGLVYKRTVDSIKLVSNVEGYNKSGNQLLDEHLIIGHVYKEIEKQLIDKSI